MKISSPLILYLAGAGVRTIGVVDPDRVDISNLHRQIIHPESASQSHGQLAEFKAISACAAAKRLNSSVEVQAHTVRFSAQNAQVGLAAPTKRSVGGCCCPLLSPQTTFHLIFLIFIIYLFEFCVRLLFLLFAFKELLANYDIVVDCTDNVQARYIINDACMLFGA